MKRVMFAIALLVVFGSTSFAFSGGFGGGAMPMTAGFMQHFMQVNSNKAVSQQTVSYENNERSTRFIAPMLGRMMSTIGFPAFK